VEYTTNRTRNKKLMIGVCGLLVFLVLVTVVFFYIHASAEPNLVIRYRVVVDNEAIGVVSSRVVVWDWLDRKNTELKSQFPTVQSSVSFKDIHFEEEWGTEPVGDDSSIMDVLEKKAEIHKRGVQITIDSKPLGIVKDETDAEALLEQYKQSKLDGLVANSDTNSTSRSVEKGKVKILSVSQATDLTDSQAPVLQSVQFVQKVELNTIDGIQPEDIADSKVLLKKIETGDVQPLRYKVISGDCVSCIAYKFQIDKQVIYDNNPTIRNNLIRIGDELDLTVLQPLLALKTIEQRKANVEIPFSTDYIDDASLKAGMKETVSSGENGLKQVVWNTTRINGELVEEAAVGETVIRPASQAVVKKGTKVIPGVGNGSFAWPVYRAKLTSEFGRRWGGFHPGTDMVSEQSGIVSSDNGKIIFAGWKTGYGNCIIIDHQNGYSTLYGHLSKILVTEGELVQKGDKIGIMGSTGNATGVHLHFEIRKGEQQENPMNYLGKAE
jgi:murein DD-endopeptidase MepM/ murein hydrolase activator NlpD